MRRGQPAGRTVTYGAVGMTQRPDIVAFPPEGFRAFHSQWRLGSGAERYSAAQASLLTWGLQRAAHVEVEVLEDGDATGYQGIEFDTFGVTGIRRNGVEIEYAPDGQPYVQPGCIVRLSGLWAPHDDDHDFRVIYVINESRRAGFAIGTLDESPVVGEEFFGVEWRDDDSVWAVVRSVTTIPESRYRWALAPIIRLRQRIQVRLSVRALTPARQAS
jgi:uncharacterized protein (UPF0548 family)